MCSMVRRPFGLENALLGFLHQSPQHGYQLYQRLCDPTGLELVWRIKQSQLYALLEKLEQSGYVSSSLQLQETHPPRRVHALTEKGEAAYLAWRISPVRRQHQMRQEFMAKLYFASQEGWEVARSLVNRQLEVCREWLSELNHGKQILLDNNVSIYTIHVLKYRTGQVKATLEWLESLVVEAN